MTGTLLAMAGVTAGVVALFALGALLLRLLAVRAFVTFARELGSYLFQPVGWIVLLLLYWFRGFEVVGLLTQAQLAPIDREQFTSAYLQTSSSVVLLLLVPAILTMRCFAEEKRSGSLEVLLTAPVRDFEVVLGKYYAALCYFALLWLPAVLLLILLGGPAFLDLSGGFALAPILSGLLGVLLVGGLFLAVGVFASSLTDNQLLSSLASMLFAFAMLFGPRYVEPFLRARATFDAPTLGETAGRVFGEELWQGDLSGLIDVATAFRDEVIYPFVQRAHVAEHLGNWFFRGVVNSGHVVFYVIGAACFVVLTTRALEARRWR